MRKKIVVLLGVLIFHTLRLKGNIQVQKVTVLVHGRTTHKLIDVSLVERINLHIKLLMASQSPFPVTILCIALN